MNEADKNIFTFLDGSEEEQIEAIKKSIEAMTDKEFEDAMSDEYSYLD